MYMKHQTEIHVRAKVYHYLASFVDCNTIVDFHAHYGYVQCNNRFASVYCGFDLENIKSNLTSITTLLDLVILFAVV